MRSTNSKESTLTLTEPEVDAAVKSYDAAGAAAAFTDNTAHSQNQLISLSKFVIFKTNKKYVCNLQQQYL